MQKGADMEGLRYAQERGFKIRRFYPGEDPRERNTEMARKGTHLIAFWNTRSTGTADMITKAQAYKRIVKIVTY